MNSPERIRCSADASKLAGEMALLFIPGHATEQSAEYLVKREAYLQALTDMAWSEYCVNPPKKSHYTSG